MKRKQSEFYRNEIKSDIVYAGVATSKAVELANALECDHAWIKWG